MKWIAASITLLAVVVLVVGLRATNHKTCRTLPGPGVGAGMVHL